MTTPRGQGVSDTATGPGGPHGEEKPARETEPTSEGAHDADRHDESHHR
jgi:hypothetical protein